VLLNPEIGGIAMAWTVLDWVDEKIRDGRLEEKLRVERTYLPTVLYCIIV